MIVYDPDRKTPNWAPGADVYLDALLLEDDVCFEWGGGQSTPWLAKRVPAGKVYTVEHDQKWVDRIAGYCKKYQNVRIIKQAKDDRHYVSVLKGIATRPTVYLIDGYHRPECLKLVMELALSGDLVVCDDALDYVDLVEELRLAEHGRYHTFSMEHPCKGTRYPKDFHRKGMHPNTKETWIWRV